MPFDGSKLDDVTCLLIEGHEHVERGWCQGACYRDGAVCMLGALGFRNDRRPEAEPLTVQKAMTRLEHAIGTHAIGAWNDAAGRTKEEVLRVFDIAIAGG